MLCATLSMLNVLLAAVRQLEGLPALGRLQDLLQPPYVYARVFCQFRVETTAKDITLTYCDDVFLPHMVVLLILLH